MNRLVQVGELARLLVLALLALALVEDVDIVVAVRTKDLNPIFGPASGPNN